MVGVLGRLGWPGCCERGGVCERGGRSAVRGMLGWEGCLGEKGAWGGRGAGLSTAVEGGLLIRDDSGTALW